MGAWIRLAAGARPVVVSRPDGSSQARLAVDTLEALTRARASNSAVCFLRPRTGGDLFPLDSEVPSVTGDGVRGLWFRACMSAHETAERLQVRLSDARSSFWRELSREVRRQAGDERLPYRLRSQLRDAARRYLSRATARRRAGEGFPRELLREPVTMTLPESLRVRARQEAEACGLREGQGVVLFEASVPGSAAACRYLVNEGYTVVRIGQPTPGVVSDRRVIDLTRQERSRLSDLFLLSIARFVVCGSSAFQQLALLTNTPSLRVDAEDVFSAYPVREHGLFTLKQAIDLDSGRFLSIRDRLTEDYYRNLRNCGYRGSTEADLLDAVCEMHEGVTGGWRDTVGQEAFRRLVTRAGEELSPRVPHVSEWGPRDGFIGLGRLARLQAERAS